MAGGAVILAGAGLETISWVYVGTFAALYSVNQASKELLYVPCMEAVKYKAKAFIDAFGYRSGAALCGFITMAGQHLGVLFRSYSALIFVVSAAWLPRWCSRTRRETT